MVAELRVVQLKATPWLRLLLHMNNTIIYLCKQNERIHEDHNLSDFRLWSPDWIKSLWCWLGLRIPEDPTYGEAQAFIEEYVGDELVDHELMSFDEIFACEDDEDEYEVDDKKS